MKRVCNWIIIFLLMSGNCVAQKRATWNISTNTMIERTVLTISSEQKAVQDSIAHAQEQERLAALKLLRLKEEQEAQQRRLEEERVRQQQEQARLQEEERIRQQEELRQQREEQQRERQQAKEDIAKNADPYYIAWLMKMRCFDSAYRKEVQAQFDIPTIMRLVNEYTEQELRQKAKGHHSNLLKYSK